MKHSFINDLLSKQELNSKDFEKLHNGGGIKTKYLSQLTLGVLMILFSSSSKYLQYFDLVTTRETCQLQILIAWLELSIGSINMRTIFIYKKKFINFETNCFYQCFEEISIIYQKKIMIMISKEKLRSKTKFILMRYLCIILFMFLYCPWIPRLLYISSAFNSWDGAKIINRSKMGEVLLYK